MNAIVLLSSRRPQLALAPGLPAFPACADNDALDDVNDTPSDMPGDIGRLDGPEPALTVSFTGITEMEQRRALASFPGGRRCTLAVA
jgi:hypothetical protein